MKDERSGVAGSVDPASPVSDSKAPDASQDVQPDATQDPSEHAPSPRARKHRMRDFTWGLGYWLPDVQKEMLPKELRFPDMLEAAGATRGEDMVPLSSAVPTAQLRIDAFLPGLDALTRRRYLRSRANAFRVYPDGTLHLLTLKRGVLRVHDDASAEEMLAVCREFGLLPELGTLGAGVEIRTNQEALAYACIVSMEFLHEWDYDEIAAPLWPDVAELLRAGRISPSDVVATEGYTDTMRYRNRASECLAYRVLMGAEAAEPKVCRRLVECLAALHRFARDESFDMAGEMRAWKDLLLAAYANHPLIFRDTILAPNEILGFHDYGEDYQKSFDRFYGDPARVIFAALEAGSEQAVEDALVAYDRSMFPWNYDMGGHLFPGAGDAGKWEDGFRPDYDEYWEHPADSSEDDDECSDEDDGDAAEGPNDEPPEKEGARRAAPPRRKLDRDEMVFLARCRLMTARPNGYALSEEDPSCDPQWLTDCRRSIEALHQLAGEVLPAPATVDAELRAWCKPLFLMLAEHEDTVIDVCFDEAEAISRGQEDDMPGGLDCRPAAQAVLAALRSGDLDALSTALDDLEEAAYPLPRRDD